MTTITLEHVSKRFGRSNQTDAPIIAIDNLSLKVASGDIVAVLGPSGCGKSTLLRMIAGITDPDSGQILYDNVPLRDIPLKERGIGMVFQDGALMPHWISQRSVGFFLELRKREHEVPERVAQISRITGFGLDALMGRLPAHLSGGERQRVGIARALARDPHVFLFDEPFSNIDAKLRTEARIELKKLLYQFPVTSVYVTHDQVEAMALAHRIAVMRVGKIEQVGTYSQLYSNPMNVFVATFIGTPLINLFEGYVRDHQWHGNNFGGFPIRADLPDGQRVTLGIRPEFVLLDPNGAPARVEAATPYYAERYQLLDVRASGDTWSLIAPEDLRVSRGATITCSLNPAGLLYFDPQSGARIG